MGEVRPVTQLVTTDESGRPRVALLGDAELDRRDSGRLSLLLWPQSHTARNLSVGGIGLAVAVRVGVLESLWFEVDSTEEIAVGTTRRRLVTGEIVDTKTDEVAYARLLHGLEFEFSDDSALARWKLAAEVFDESRASAARHDEPRQAPGGSA